MGTSRKRSRVCDLREIGQREIGSRKPFLFTRRLGGSEVFAERLDLYGKLSGHKGCVNTVHFNPSGDILISGSDDRQVIFWDWVAKSKRVTYHSGHQDNVFQARIMPYTDDRCIVTTAADGQVRLGQIKENGHVSTKQLGIHHGRAHKLAIEPGSSHLFFSCGEDGVVQQFDLRSHSAMKLFTCTSFTENRRPVRLNAIVIDPRNPNYFSVGGLDEYARIYDLRNCQTDDASSRHDRPVDTFCPRHLVGSNVHITGLAYSYKSELLVSYNDELIYLFQKGMGVGADPKSVSTEALQSLDQPQVYSGHRNSKTVKGVNFFGPNDDYVVSGSDCGHVFIWRKTDGKLLRMVVGDKQIVNCIEPHPHFPFLATSGLEKNVKLWMPVGQEIAPLPTGVEQILESNKRGREDSTRIILSPDVIMHVLRLQRRQAQVYTERREAEGEGEPESEDDEPTFIIGYGDGDGEEDDGNPRECTIS